jgi:hypothetical protein
MSSVSGVVCLRTIAGALPPRSRMPPGLHRHEQAMRALRDDHMDFASDAAVLRGRGQALRTLCACTWLAPPQRCANRGNYE